MPPPSSSVPPSPDVDVAKHEAEVEAMIGVDGSSSPSVRSRHDEDVDTSTEDADVVVDALRAESQEQETTPAGKSGKVKVWPEISTARAKRYQMEVDAIREHFEEEVDMFDTTMVSEYADEIFKYMEELEVRFPSFSRLIVFLT